MLGNADRCLMVYKFAGASGMYEGGFGLKGSAEDKYDSEKTRNSVARTLVLWYDLLKSVMVLNSVLSPMLCPQRHAER